MTVRRPLVVSGGQVKELPPGDTLPPDDTKQNEIYKTVFQLAVGAINPGWIRLGTLTGDNQSRWEVKVTGKQGWNDQNFPGQAILHGSTNYIGSDTGQIAAGCKWLESTGSGPVATAFALVRQAGYASAKFDLYILLDLNYSGWLVEVTTMAGGWVTSIAYNQADPGTGANVFRPTKRTIWDDGNLPSNNLPRLDGSQTWTGNNVYFDGITREASVSYSGPTGFVLLGEMLITGSGGSVNVEVDVFDANTTTNEGTLVNSGAIVFDCSQFGSMSLPLQRIYAQGAKWSGYLSPSSTACYSITTNNATEKRVKIFVRCLWGRVNFRITSIVQGAASFIPSVPTLETPASPVYAKNTHERIGTGEIDDLLLNGGLRLTSDIQVINGGNATMAKMRAVITDTVNRIVTLPDPSLHSVAILMVKESPLVKHRVYPPSGSRIFWTAHDGVYGITDSTGSPALRVTLGMYWFVSDGTDWYLMSPCTD